MTLEADSVYRPIRRNTDWDKDIVVPAIDFDLYGRLVRDLGIRALMEEAYPEPASTGKEYEDRYRAVRTLYDNGAVADGFDADEAMAEAQAEMIAFGAGIQSDFDVATDEHRENYESTSGRAYPE